MTLAQEPKMQVMAPKEPVKDQSLEKEIISSDAPGSLSLKKKRQRNMPIRFANPYMAAERSDVIDEVIFPRRYPQKINKGFAGLLENKVVKFCQEKNMETYLCNIL